MAIFIYLLTNKGGKLETPSRYKLSKKMKNSSLRSPFFEIIRYSLSLSVHTVRFLLCRKHLQIRERDFFSLLLLLLLLFPGSHCCDLDNLNPSVCVQYPVSIIKNLRKKEEQRKKGAKKSTLYFQSLDLSIKLWIFTPKIPISNLVYMNFRAKML